MEFRWATLPLIEAVTEEKGSGKLHTRIQTAAVVAAMSHLNAVSMGIAPGGFLPCPYIADPSGTRS